MGARKHLLLIVEDHDLTRWALSKLLGRNGWTVLTAATIREGLDLLETRPDCVVLDLMLPDGAGEVVLRRVRDEELPTRVIVTTGTGDEDRLEALKDLQPAGILRKPIDVEEVCRICEAAPV